MKRILALSGLAVALLTLPTSRLLIAQQIIFSEDFESGAADASWGAYRDGEETVTAVEMSLAPIPLPNGGSYVGYMQDADGTYAGAAIALAGATDLSDYSIEADVYCYVNNPDGSAYTGLVAYANATSGIYVKLAADFDADQRFRLYNSRLNTSTFEYTFHHAFTAADVPGGIPTNDGWHHLKMEVKTLNADTTAYWCYFDGQLLKGSPVYDTGDDRVSNGRFGLFAFQQNNFGIAGFFDNIVVKSLSAPTSVGQQLVRTSGSALKPNQPNPFDARTILPYSLSENGFVTLTIHDLFGRRIRTIVSGYRQAGDNIATWAGDDDFGAPAPAGVYVCRLVSNGTVESRRIVLER